MKDLKCGLKACRFNKGYCCTSKEIEISEQADCLVFAPDENKRRLQFEAANEFTPVKHSVDTQVGCGADCIFNKSGKCISNGITVMSRQPQDASCLTFIKN